MSHVLRQDHLDQWLALAATTPSADNSQPWQFDVRGHAMAVSYEMRAASPLFDAHAHATLLSIGAMAHMLQTCGAEINGFDHTGNTTYFTATLPDAPPRAAAVFLERHTNRHPYKTVKVDRPQFASAAFAADTRIVALHDREKISVVSSAVRALSAHRFRNQKQHESLMGSLRFSDEEVAQGDGLDAATLHLPPGGQSFMRWISPWPRAQSLHRFGIAAIMAKAEADLFNTCGAVLVIIGKKSVASTRNAGAAMIEVWAQINADQLAAHPWYVLSQGSFFPHIHAGQSDDGSPVARDFDALNATLGLAPDEMVHIVLRVGVARKKPVRSRRLAAEKLISPS
jgi:hypothetical protein